MTTNPTAEERAEQVFASDIDGMLDGMCDIEDKKEICASIADAIKSAEEAAREEGLKQELKNSMQICKEASEEGYAEGFRAGAESMRERAAAVTDKYWEDGWGNGASADKCGQEIRALPIETKTTMPDPTHGGK